MVKVGHKTRPGVLKNRYLFEEMKEDGEEVHVLWRVGIAVRRGDKSSPGPGAIDLAEKVSGVI